MSNKQIGIISHKVIAGNFVILGILIPFFVLSRINSTTDVLIGRIIIWSLIWTIPHFYVAYKLYVTQKFEMIINFSLTISILISLSLAYLFVSYGQLPKYFTEILGLLIIYFAYYKIAKMKSS